MLCSILPLLWIEVGKMEDCLEFIGSSSIVTCAIQMHWFSHEKNKGIAGMVWQLNQCLELSALASTDSCDDINARSRNKINVQIDQNSIIASSSHNILEET